MTEGRESIIKNYVDQVERARAELSTYVDQAGGEIASRVDDSTGRLFTKLDEAARAINVGIEENSNVLVERLTASTEAAAISIGTSSAQLLKLVETSRSGMSEGLEKIVETYA